jgi:membrane fusion protein (multidrug efflux system)
VDAGAVRIVVEVADGAALPPPGEGVEVSLELALRPTALLVPLEAVVIDGDQSSVFVTVREAAGLRARRRAVVLGARRDGWVEVIEGLREGERVAVDGVAFLADGDRVSEVRDARPPTPPRWEPAVEGERVRP